MATMSPQENKEFLIKVLSDNLKWSVNLMKPFKEESVKEIYDCLMNGEVIKKTKPSAASIHSLSLYIPVEVSDAANIQVEDRFKISVNIKTMEIILRKDRKGTIEFNKQNKFVMPNLLVERGYLKRGYDTMVRYDGDKIVIRSFIHM